MQICAVITDCQVLRINITCYGKMKQNVAVLSQSHKSQRPFYCSTVASSTCNPISCALLYMYIYEIIFFIHNNYFEDIESSSYQYKVLINIFIQQFNESIDSFKSILDSLSLSVQQYYISTDSTTLKVLIVVLSNYMQFFVIGWHNIK